MKKIVTLILIFSFYIGCEGDGDSNCQLVDNCAKNITFQFEGTNLWDDDDAVYITLDGNQIQICEQNFEGCDDLEDLADASGCLNVFDVDLDNNPSGQVDLDITTQYMCNPSSGGLFNAGYMSTDIRIQNIGSFISSIGTPISIDQLNPQPNPVISSQFQFYLGNTCSYRTESGYIIFSEINLQTSTFSGTFYFDLDGDDVQLNQNCYPLLENVSVTGSFNLSNVSY